MAGCRENSISEQYIFNITTPDGSFQAQPFNNTLEWKFTYKEGFPWVELETELVFKDSIAKDCDDFSQLYPYERNRERCEKIYVEIQRVWKGSAAPFFNGFFRVGDCKWNVSNSICTAKINTENPYTCIIENWNKRFNIIDYADAETISRIEGELEVVTCVEDIEDQFFNVIEGENGGINWFYAEECLPERENYVTLYPRGYNILEAKMSWTPNGGLFGNPLLGTLHVETTWVREIWTAGGVPTDPLWKYDDESGVYYKYIQTYLLEETDSSPGQVSSVYKKYEFLNEINAAYSFNTVVENVLNEYCADNVISNFYGINPDGSNPDNKYYTRALEENEMKFIYIVPKSELLNFGAANRATDIFNEQEEKGYTFKDFLEDIRNLHGVELRYIDGTYYLEHISYFKREYRLNLTQEKYAFNLRGAWQYQYFKANMPSSEEWNMMEETDVNGDFDSSLVEYENCLFDEEKNEVYQINAIVNNIEALYAAGFKEDNPYSKDGISLISTNNKVILFADGEISGGPRMNGNQALPRLIQRYLTFKRPKRIGTWNNIELHFDNPYEIRQIENTICIPLTDLDEFNIEDYCKTQLNWGVISEARLISPANFLTLTTQHK